VYKDWLATAAVTLLAILGGIRPAAGQDRLEAYAFLVGAWEGELEYLDYGDDRTRVRLPTSLMCNRSGDGTSLELRFSYEEPDGRVETSTERLAESPEGLYLGELWRIEEAAHRVSAGTYRLVLERQGEDSGRAASIRNTVLVQGDDLTITTLVTYSGSTEALQRHQYRLRRVD